MCTCRFTDHERLSFPLLSDFNKEVIREYGVFDEDMIGGQRLGAGG